MVYKNIYIIDDDKIFHFIMKKLFKVSGLEVKTNYFLNGKLALEALKVKENIPDLILLDINMPIIDGWQFVEEYKSLQKEYDLDIPIFIVSSSDDKTDKQKAEIYKNEVKNYFLKPFCKEDFQKIFV